MSLSTIANWRKDHGFVSGDFEKYKRFLSSRRKRLLPQIPQLRILLEAEKYLTEASRYARLLSTHVCALKYKARNRQLMRKFLKKSISAVSFEGIENKDDREQLKVYLLYIKGWYESQTSCSKSKIDSLTTLTEALKLLYENGSASSYWESEISHRLLIAELAVDSKVKLSLRKEANLTEQTSSQVLNFLGTKFAIEDPTECKIIQPVLFKYSNLDNSDNNNGILLFLISEIERKDLPLLSHNRNSSLKVIKQILGIIKFTLKFHTTFSTIEDLIEKKLALIFEGVFRIESLKCSSYIITKEKEKGLLASLSKFVSPELGVRNSEELIRSLKEELLNLDLPLEVDSFFRNLLNGVENLRAIFLASLILCDLEVEDRLLKCLALLHLPTDRDCCLEVKLSDRAAQSELYKSTLNKMYHLTNVELKRFSNLVSIIIIMRKHKDLEDIEKRPLSCSKSFPGFLLPKPIRFDLMTDELFSEMKNSHQEFEELENFLNYFLSENKISDPNPNPKSIWSRVLLG